MSNKKTIWDIHHSKTGKSSDKWSSYLRYYDRLFERERDKAIRLLEIGVQNGGSLDTWAEYFDQATHIVGCDKDPRCKTLTYSDERISVVVGDIKSSITKNTLSEICGSFDVIIDDGSHQSDHIIDTFNTLFSLLNPGGFYIIEDTHTLYYERWGGGLLNELSAQALFKKLTDIINVPFWREEVSPEAYLKSFTSAAKIPDFYLDGCIESIEFRNSIITIRKLGSTEPQGLGDRLIVGGGPQITDIVEIRE